MNTKIIVALVIAIAVVGLTGAASAGYISTYTDITATRFTSESSLSVSGIQTEQHYKQDLVAEFRFPIFPPVDLCCNDIDIRGDSFLQANKINSAPSGSRVSTVINNVASVEGSWTHWDCAMWGAGIGPQEADLPYPISKPSIYTWYSSHFEGDTDPAHSIEHQNIHWP